MESEPPDGAGVVVVGAGPAGLMAALGAAAAGYQTTVYERQERPGLKLLATGGGRCNFCNLSPLPDFLGKFPEKTARFIRPSLYAFDSAALRRFFNKEGVDSFSPDGWRVYPETEYARDVLGGLLNACRRAGVRICCGVAVKRLLRENGAVCGVECASASGGGEVRCARVVIAAGGCCRTDLGSDGSGWELARSAGHRIMPAVPALVPLVTREKWVEKLAGISLKGVKVTLIVDGKRERTDVGDFLFTHKGVSGPAVLDLSGDAAAALAAGKSAALAVDLVPAVRDWRQQMRFWRQESGGGRMGALLAEYLPHRLVKRILEDAGTGENESISTLTGDQERALEGMLDGFMFTVSGTEGFGAAMVARGGVALAEVNPKTLESRKCRGLYFAGEVLDVDGPCGGYNLQWAFSSGHAVHFAGDAEKK